MIVCSKLHPIFLQKVYSIWHLTCRRFGAAPSPDTDGDNSLSLVEEATRRIVHDIATEEQMNALPCYDEDNWLCNYNYLKSLRTPLTFDHLVGNIDYVGGNKSHVTCNVRLGLATAFSNNIMMAGKHYVSFEAHNSRSSDSLYIGVMRPGEAMQSSKYIPLLPSFYEHFTQREGSRQYNNTVNCCMYSSLNGYCFSHAWGEGKIPYKKDWDGMEGISGSFEIGMLLDLDEGTLSVYNSGRKLGVMKRGLAGHYCWVVSLLSSGSRVIIKRGTVPLS